MARRWISTFLAALMLANLVAWPSAVLAEALEHQHEDARQGTQTPPAEPSSEHCKHGCAGHYGQHFQAQISARSPEPRIVPANSISAISEVLSPQHIPSLPFRPPLIASIRS